MRFSGHITLSTHGSGGLKTSRGLYLRQALLRQFGRLVNKGPPVLKIVPKCAFVRHPCVFVLVWSCSVRGCRAIRKSDTWPHGARLSRLRS
ncbi:hypothetical protein DNJ95_18235 [Stutzerimonas kirkiae]|nr:hypothetical protein DNJ95_18235 [Stutzerimonas kirkiae]TBV10684.1 hypothetical protein DNK01_17435 [Stutzerimonas kirkiae]